MVTYWSHWSGPCWTGDVYLLQLLLQAESLSRVQSQGLWLRAVPSCVRLLAELLLPPHKRQLLLHRFEHCGWSITRLVSGLGAEARVAAQSVGVSGFLYLCWFPYLLFSSSTGNLISTV